MGEKKIVGLALCGSYCSYDKVFAAAGALAEKYELIPIMSGTAAATDSRGREPAQARRADGAHRRGDDDSRRRTARPRKADGCAADRAVHRQHACDACARDNGQRRDDGGEGASSQRAATRTCDIDERRAFRLRGKYRTAAEPEERLFRPLRAGRSGEEALLASGGFRPDGRKRGFGDGGSAASANFDCKIMALRH